MRENGVIEMAKKINGRSKEISKSERRNESMASKTAWQRKMARQNVASMAAK
jgi:hypothetical protein